MSQRLHNNFSALATHFGCWDIGRLALILTKHGLRDKTTGALLRRLGSYGNPVDVDALAGQGFDLQQDAVPQLGHSVLHLAARLGRAGTMAHLIDVHGVPVDLILQDETTPLSEACAHRRFGTASALLARGAQPNKGDRWPPVTRAWSSLDSVSSDPAQIRKVNRVLRLLLEAGASPNAPGRHGGGAPILHQALATGDGATVALLDEFGVDWASLDINGRTALQGVVPGTAGTQLAAEWGARLMARRIPEGQRRAQAHRL